MITPEFLDITAAIVPERLAIIFEDKRINYEQLAERVNRLATALAGLGVKKGDTVSLIQVNTHHCIETYFAVARLGAIYVPLNFRARPNEFEYMIHTADTKVVLAGERYVPIINGLKDKLPTVEHCIALDGPADGWLEYEKLVTSHEPDPPYTEVEDEATTVLMYTSGTTGNPKGVMLHHHSFVSYVMTNVSPVDMETEERNILTVPLYHIAGTQAVMAAIYGGRTLIMQRQFEPAEWMALVQHEKVNRAMMVPTMLKQLMDHPDFHKYDLSSLKVITYGAAPMPLEVITKALEEFPGSQFINAFGQTETAATVTALAPEDHVIPPDLPEAERVKRLKRLSSVGKALSDVEIKIVDEDGKDVPHDVVGEIVARGSRVMSGYWKDEEKTKNTMRGGWIYTGDMGYQDEDGYFFLSGRASDLIIRAGENISPEEVEGVLNSHAAVEESAVFGIPDVTWGETIAAAVVLKSGQTATEEELSEWCRKNLSSYKKPERVVFINELPRNLLGKILRKDLRAQYGETKTPA
ncbi:MAG TPA: long-chain-fatty-acid--CoA ligase [Dehalococcoidia bacterium]|nr:long-chain-fatty-acid--CoA ligase [Dehalococcoidia bacterium]